MSKKYRVDEIFRSISGETSTAGTPSVFVRLYGCNLKCPYCIGIKNGRHIPRVITTLGENKKINEVKVGDRLLTLDDNSHKVETEVTNVLTREVSEHYGVKIEGKSEIYCTGEHPFMTQRGWVEAKDLTTEDEIIHITPNEKVSFNKELYNPMKSQEVVDKKDEEVLNEFLSYYHNGLKVERVKLYKTPLKVYNFSCSPYNTYMVDYMLVHNCDTPQEKCFTVMQDYEILAKVIEESKGVINHVILTGGEPLCQDIVPLVQLLIKHGFHIQIETNGTRPLPIMHNWVSYAMDIKLPSSEVDDKYKDIMRDNLHNLLPTDEVKFVISNVQDFRVAMNWINDNDIQAKLLFSPMFDEEGKMMYTDFIKDLLNSELKNWRVQVQMHKILGVK